MADEGIQTGQAHRQRFSETSLTRQGGGGNPPTDRPLILIHQITLGRLPGTANQIDERRPQVTLLSHGRATAHHAPTTLQHQPMGIGADITSPNLKPSGLDSRLTVSLPYSIPHTMIPHTMAATETHSLMIPMNLIPLGNTTYGPVR